MKVWNSGDQLGQRKLFNNPVRFAGDPVAAIAATNRHIAEDATQLIEVDYTSSKKALIESQKYSPYELGFGKMVHLEKENFIGKAALVKQQKQGVPRQFVGLEIDWPEVEARYEEFGLTPAAPSQASRVAVPVYLGEKQVGKATTTTWSPVLKKMIALASVDTAYSQIGTKLQLEITIEAMRQQVTAKIVKMPFFNPERKTAVPV